MPFEWGAVLVGAGVGVLAGVLARKTEHERGFIAGVICTAVSMVGLNLYQVFQVNMWKACTAPTFELTMPWETTPPLPSYEPPTPTCTDMWNLGAGAVALATGFAIAYAVIDSPHREGT